MDFGKLETYFSHLPDINIPGADLAVYQDHKEVFRSRVGYADLETKTPLTAEHVFRMFSCTKVFTCICALRLIEEGKLDLDAEVSRYLPAFRNMLVRDGESLRPAIAPVRVWNLMSMTAGLDYDMNVPSVQKVLEETGGKATTRQIVDALAEKPLRFEPGTHFFYSLCHDVLAAVIEVVSGKRFSDYVNEVICEPLGMRHTTFHPDAEYLRAMATRYEWQGGDPRNLRPVTEEKRRISSENYESGGGGLCSCVDDYIKALDAMACGGVGWNGYRLLKPETIDLARRNWMCPAAEWDVAIDLQNRGYSYGLGFRTLQHPEHIASRGVVGEFGWGGAAGAYAVMEPEHHFSICYVQHVMNCGYAFTNVQPTIRELTYEALGIHG